MTLVPFTILVPEDFLAKLIANGVQVQVLPDKGHKLKRSTPGASKKGVTQHHSAASSRKTQPVFPSQRNNFLGGRTPSELFKLYQRPAKPTHKKHLVVSEPCHRPEYPTASQLLFRSAHPPKVGKKIHYPAEKENLTSSKLSLAYKKASGRPELFHGLTASQLLVQNERQKSRSANYKKYMSARLYPTPSQLFVLGEGGQSKPQPKKPSGQKPVQPKKQQAPSGKKEQLIQRMTPKTEPRSLLEPTPSLLLLKHLSLIPSFGNDKKQQKQKPAAVKKQKSQKEMERNELRLEPLLFGF
jgi:hypothetical protein